MERHRRQEHAKKFSSEEGLPQWAPWELVYYYYELKHDKAMSLCPIEARQDVQPMLRRLITHADMANVWNALCNKPRSDKYIRLSPDELPSLIFIAIVQAWKSFQNQMRDPQTYAQKKTELLKLAKKTDSLINEIGQSLVAQELSEVVLSTLLGERIISFRREMGEHILNSEDAYPHYQLNKDNFSARRTFLLPEDAWPFDKSGSYDKAYSWEDLPIASRVAGWSAEAEATTLTSLLIRYSDLLKMNAVRAPDIKQPGRGSTAFLAFLIRRLHGHMVEYYGQPLDELVAQIVNAALDIRPDRFLDRDSVRSYTKSDG